MRPILLPALVAFINCISCTQFPYESIQLKSQDTIGFPSIAFGNRSHYISNRDRSPCKAFPGTSTWPIESEWDKLNGSLSGALLKPAPPASVCYDGTLKDPAACTFLLKNASSTRFYLDNPLTVLTEWPQGDTCYATADPQGATCTQGGFPVYVVNATTVEHIQLAVNFARNRNVRLVIKNTGHDFLGRSVGAGSISIWTHYLKGFEYLPEYTQGRYKGPAARVGAGLEAWELYPLMDQYDMAIVAPAGSTTVGVYGGWLAGGGHSVLSSYYGMGADQALELSVVTADGKFLNASPEINQDLFYALRGGGGSTYGIVVSAVVKAYPRLVVGMAPLNFNVRPPSTNPPSTPALAKDLAVFWMGVNQFFFYGKYITSVGGTAFSYVSKQANTSYSFTNTFEMPGMSASQVIAAVQPLFDDLNSIGIPVGNVSPVASLLWAPSTRQGRGDTPGNSRFASRLFPRRNWDNATIFNSTMSATQEFVEAGYTFHGIHMAPTEAIAGYPGNNAVNPAFRDTYMHADSFDFASLRGKTPEENKISHDRHDFYMEKIRRVTPGGGAYMNEADLLEPEWQESFFGRENYEKLVGIKKNWDPWGVFWAPTTPGSEAWQVMSVDGRPDQNGRLCRAGSS
ncbi:FAD binding domain-containing protein [Cadophora sp. MPI-SDFR-AT-0126]|nr:FAD binding domain-containing protein [Leotiomycetes sp. MPI-SDFR-AT-0126]